MTAFDLPDRLKLLEWDRAHSWYPFTQMQEWVERDPLVIDRAEGVHLIDDQGRRYLDGVSSLWVNVHGHRHPRIDAALKEQLDRMAHSTMLGLAHAPAVALAHALAEQAPKGLTRVFYSDDGATAVEVALKMAFQHFLQTGRPERTRFVHFQGAYHGDTLGAVGVGGISLFHRVFGPLVREGIPVPAPYCYRCPEGLDPASCARDCLGGLERVLEEHGSQVAAVIVEPGFQGAAGMIVLPDGFLAGVREITRRHGVLLIADEVAAGFGRTGSLFACARENVTPDLMALGKGLTGGYMPLAATLATEDVFRSFLGSAASGRAFYHGHSYAGNPLGCAAALASLHVFQEEGVLDRIRPLIRRFHEGLDAFRAFPHVGDVRYVGLVAGIELVRDRNTKEPFPAEARTGHRVCMEARRLGAVLRPLGDVVVLMPPLAIREDELDRLLQITAGAVRAVTEEGP